MATVVVGVRVPVEANSHRGSGAKPILVLERRDPLR
jgi:hypothetical protein